MDNQKNSGRNINRREFVHHTGKILALGMAGFPCITKEFAGNTGGKALSRIRIRNVSSDFEREPLGTPYHFKGSAITECWQTAAWLEAESGIHTIGLGTQGILWSDSKVFFENSESGGNALMYAMTGRALQIIKGTAFTNPLELLDELLP